MENWSITPRPFWAPEDLDITRPNTARMYDYLLGGFHNFEVDRQVVEKSFRLFPEAPLHARLSRRFLRKSVEHLAELGVDQFLDIGSGIPTVGAVHEAALAVNPDARIAYVDVDPVVVAHSKAILRDVPEAVVVEGDIRHPEQILANEQIATTIDFTKPVGLIMVLLLHFVTDDEEAYRCVNTLKRRLTGGSHLVLSHSTLEGAPPDIAAFFKSVTEKTPTPHKYRTKLEIEAFYDGCEIIEPGVIHLPLWQPESLDDPLLKEPGRSLNFCGIGRIL